MRSSKKRKSLDPPASVREFVEQHPAHKLEGLLRDGLRMKPSLVPAPPRPVTFQELWERIPPEEWDAILSRRRLCDIALGDEVAEWERYRELMHRLGRRHHNELFLGLHPETNTPVYVPRDVFAQHAYILGLPGTGKTSQALAQLLLQLGENPASPTEPAPLVILDLKEGGDSFLRALAERIADARQQKVRFFSNDPDYVSLRFDPLFCLRSIRYPLKLGETLLKALSLIYREGYGSDFFTAEQRAELLRVLYENHPRTLDQLIGFVHGATTGGSGNKDARGLHSSLAPLRYSFHLLTGSPPSSDDEDLIDLERLYEKREVLYVHLNSRSQSIDAKVIGKLLIFALVETAAERKKRGCPRQIFVAIDEFQRLAAENIVEVLEDSRSLGVGFIFSHQSPESLHTRESDLYRMIADLCSFKQFLSLTNEHIIESLRLVSSRKSEYRKGWSSATTKGTERSGGSSWGRASGSSTHYEPGFWGTETGRTDSGSVSFSDSSATSRMESESQGSSGKEEMVPALTPEMVALVNGTPLLSLIHVQNAAPKSLTPLNGLPALVQGLYPVTEQEASAMAARPWQMKLVPVEEFYAKAAPKVPAAAVAALVAEATGRAASKRPGREQPSPEAKAVRALSPREKEERRKLQQRIRALAESLAPHVPVEGRHVERFAREQQLGVAKVLELAGALGLKVTKRDDWLKPGAVRALTRLLDQRGASPGDQKDNGPAHGPVV